MDTELRTIPAPSDDFRSGRVVAATIQPGSIPDVMDYPLPFMPDEFHDHTLSRWFDTFNRCYGEDRWRVIPCPNDPLVAVHIWECSWSGGLNAVIALTYASPDLHPLLTPS